ncbi:protein DETOXIFICATION 45, chloroplastic-like isoform X1 [Ananas comosus]|uniref:Protein DETOXIFICATION n=1 Tax=Ananas comosus TaxID=4615 RepID=A0A6P5GYE3_ANACO|nr:protein DETOXIFICATION 45, chloroplastic-like isoform X1 [Ananas comosus]XP_020112855.1 protein DETOXIFICATION 45, chloroplastic-like isoform X1 [Ananas comosus]
MNAVQKHGLASGLAGGYCNGKAKKRVYNCSSLPRCSVGSNSFNILNNSHLSLNHAKLPSLTTCRKRTISVANSHSISEYGASPDNADERFDGKKGHSLDSVKEAIVKLAVDLGGLHPGSVRSELILLALPAVIGQAIDPLGQLMETAYIGRLGPLELASAGVAVSLFNIISKIFNIPLLSITTSFVAEDISRNATGQSISDENFQDELITGAIEERLKLPSVSSALLLAFGIGTIEALAMFFGSGLFLNMMGVSPASPMRRPSQLFLSLRALGAPAVVVSLAVQGVFRGFKDTKTPLLYIGLGNLSAIVLLPLLVYSLRLGITGAAIATVASQYICTFLLIWSLSKRAVILPPKIEELEFGGYIKSGALLLGRTLSILITLTLGTSMAARQGPLAMAAHQICMQVWLAVSLLSDALAVSAQALIASSFAKFDYKRVKETTYLVLQTGLVSGIVLAVGMCATFGSLAKLFTNDPEVLQIVNTGVLFVCASQPINTLAFIADGLHYGVSDFSYVGWSTMVVGAISSLVLLVAPSIFGLAGVWAGLTLLMGLRMVAGILRLCWKSGPWWFLHQEVPTYEPIPTSDSMLQIDAEWESKVELQPEKVDYTYAITTE